jgi:hypothetical protein
VRDLLQRGDAPSEVADRLPMLLKLAIGQMPHAEIGDAPEGRAGDLRTHIRLRFVRSHHIEAVKISSISAKRQGEQEPAERPQVARMLINVGDAQLRLPKERMVGAFEHPPLLSDIMDHGFQ